MPDPRPQRARVVHFDETLDLRDLTLVVQDWGGPIGLGMAVRHPDRVRALAEIGVEIRTGVAETGVLGLLRAHSASGSSTSTKVYKSGATGT